MAQFNNINNFLIIRYLRNELTEDEKMQVIKWMESDPQNLEFLMGLKEAYLVSRWPTVKNMADVDFEWEKIKSKIDLKREPRKIFNRSLLLKIAKVAAIVIVGFGLGFFGNKLIENSKEEITQFSTGQGRKSVVELADGSKVTLNAQSTLTYTKSIKDKRVVNLSGEGVFEIKPDHGKPFYVNTNNFIIKVLGTVFNVSTYDNDDYTSITLKKGKVQILEKGSDLILSELKVGERFNFDKKTGSYSIQMQKDLNTDFGWYNGSLCFNDISLKDLANKLEREFGFAIEIRNHPVQIYRYKAYIEKENIENILKYISMITPDVHYRIDTKARKVLIY